MRRINRLAFWLITLSCLLACAIPLILKSAQAQNRQQTVERIPGVPEGYTIIEGDIVMPIEVINTMRNQARLKPDAPQATFTVNTWPNGIVYYGFDTVCKPTSSCSGAPNSGCVSPANQTAMRDAMAVIEAVANVRFLQCPNNDCGGSAPPHILIRDSTNDTTGDPGAACKNAAANNSQVGYQGRGQAINITSWGAKFVIVHELLHALGFFHEQTRPDRDAFITVNCGAIQDDKGDCSSDKAKNNFSRMDGALAYGPYDFDSLMHYGQCDFAKNCDCDAMNKCKNPTISVTDAFKEEWQKKIGQRDHLSYLDRITLSSLYPRGDSRFVGSAFNFLPLNGIVQDGRFIFPYKDLSIAVAATPRGGTLWIQPGRYAIAYPLSKPITMLAPLGGVSIVKADILVSGGGPLASVSAANYNGELASEALVAAFGGDLATETAVATSQPLPTTLAGVTVKVKDSKGVERDAPLFFVSPSQINYMVPAGTSAGVAQVSVIRGLIRAKGEVPINATAPGLFTANGSGSGVPAAYALRVRGDAQIVEPLLRYDEGQKQFVPAPIDLGTEGDLVFLVLFGTGFRFAMASGVIATVGGENAEVFYAGAAPGYDGVDQANVLLPRSLAGKGDVNILLTADNRSANAVTINVR